MKKYSLILLHALIGSAILLTATSCSTTAVEERQSGITAAQANLLDNSSARIQARDARFDASRDHWLQ